MKTPGGTPKGRVFAPFWSENGHILCSVLSGIGCGFQENYGSVRTYLLFQFQMSNNNNIIIKKFIARKYLYEYNQMRDKNNFLRKWCK